MDVVTLVSEDIYWEKKRLLQTKDSGEWGHTFGMKKKSLEMVSEDILWREQGRIHGNPVADGWAEAIVWKPLGIQKCYGTDRPTDQPSRQGDRVACPRLKKDFHS